MSAPVREPDQDGPSKDGPSKEEPSKYAPKKARPPEPDPAPAGTPPQGDAPKGGASEPADPPWRRSRQRGSGGTAFVGDVAIAELRTKLALAPDRLPEPPPASSRRSKLVWTGRLTGIAVVLAVGLIGYRWGSSPASRFQLPHPSSHARTPAAPDQPVTATAQDPAGRATVLNAVPAIYPPPAKAIPSNGRTSRQLAIGAVPAQQADDVARLAISAADAGINAAVVIGGLAAGSALSAGKEVAPNTWRLSVDNLPGVSVTPPGGFVGIMDLTVELRLADNSVTDRKSLQLEWVGRGVAKSPARQHDAAEIAQMLQKGDELMTNGDVAAARLMYQRAAEAGDATAAFALAETYDPLVLAKGGIPPDTGLAQAWYRKARDLGSAQAPERLERLVRLSE